MLFQLGRQVAAALGLDPGQYRTEEYIALAEETMRDHLLSGNAQHLPLLIGMARGAGKLDNADLDTGDGDRIAEQISAFLESAFKQEIELSNVALDLAQAPPPLTRKELADALLREAGIDPQAYLAGSDTPYAYEGIAAFTPPLIVNSKAAEYYFDHDALSADVIAKMRLLGGGRPTADDVRRILARLPASLDAEFGKQFDARTARTAALCSQWLRSRLSAYERDHHVDLHAANVAVSRPKLQYYAEEAQVYNHTYSTYDKPHSEIPASGFFVTCRFEGAPPRHLYIAANGTLRTLAAHDDPVRWISQNQADLFASHATPGVRGIKSRVIMEETGAGPHAAMAKWLPSAFRKEAERQRQAARGQTATEIGTEMLLDMIPGWNVAKAIRDGDWRSAVLHGALTVADLLPSVISGIRWAAKAVKVAKVASQGATIGLRAVTHTAPTLRESIKAVLKGASTHIRAGLRPLDLDRVAMAIRSASPRLASDLRGMAARTRGAALPAGTWKIVKTPIDPTAAADAIRPTPIVKARSQNGAGLELLPYGGDGRAYTRFDASGQRVGAVLLTDGTGVLHETLPLDALRRYRVSAPDTLLALATRPTGADGTALLGDVHYVRIGEDYMQVVADAATSTADRRIWRAAPPDDVPPDVVAYRLVHDSRSGMWRRPDPPQLKGGGPRTARTGAAAGKAETSTGGRAATAGLSPSNQDRYQFMETMWRNIAGGATEKQRAWVALLLMRIGNTPRGDAILRALTAWRKYVGETPQVAFRQPGLKGVPDKVSQALSTTKYWAIDPATLSGAPSEAVLDAATDELAKIYDKMTRLSRHDSSGGTLALRSDPVGRALADGKVRLRKDLDDLWGQWASDESIPAERHINDTHVQRLPYRDNRQRLIDGLRLQTQKTKLLGGTPEEDLKRLIRGQPVRNPQLTSPYLEITLRTADDLPPLPSDMEHLKLRIADDAPAMGASESVEMSRLPRDKYTVMNTKGDILNDPDAVPKETPALGELLPDGLRVLVVEGDGSSVTAHALGPSIEVTYAR